MNTSYVKGKVTSRIIMVPLDFDRVPEAQLTDKKGVTKVIIKTSNT